MDGLQSDLSHHHRVEYASPTFGQPSTAAVADVCSSPSFQEFRNSGWDPFPPDRGVGISRRPPDVADPSGALELIAPVLLSGKSLMARVLLAASLLSTALGASLVGTKAPSVDLDFGFPPTKVNLAERVKGKKVIVVGLPGAFTPT